MPTSLSATLRKLELTRSSENRVILRAFYEYILSKDLRNGGEHHIAHILALLISLDKFYGLSFTSINTEEQILTFLDHQYVNDKGWVRREHDAEGRYITSFNHYLGLLRVFFRWFHNSYNRDRRKDDTDDDIDTNWETPLFLRKIKTKKPLRDSPYDNNEIWKLEDLLTIVPYESEPRNQAIITLMWDLDARNHEITALRLRDIVLNEQYGEGNIPLNTKT